MPFNFGICFAVASRPAGQPELELYCPERRSETEGVNASSSAAGPVRPRGALCLTTNPAWQRTAGSCGGGQLRRRAGGRAATGSARGPEGSRFPVLIGRAGQLALYGPRAKTGPTCREGEATPRAGPQARRPVSRRFWKREPRVTPDWLECPPGAGRGDHKRTGRAAPRALAPRELASSADGRTGRLTD